MILVDTSVWIDFFGKTNPNHVKKLISIIELNENICTNGLILTEVLQGIRNDQQYIKVKNYFDSLIFLPMGYDIFIHSATIYRNLRAKGITIRKPIDCMIAATAIEHRVVLLHNDRDFDPITKYCGLKAIKK